MTVIHKTETIYMTYITLKVCPHFAISNFLIFNVYHCVPTTEITNLIQHFKRKKGGEPNIILIHTDQLQILC